MKSRILKFKISSRIADLSVFFLSLCTLHFAFSTRVYAATIIFDPQETTVGLETSFLVGLTLASEKPINAISVVVDVPYPLSVVDFSDGDSIINFWTVRPHVNDAGKLEFAGIIPGGFSGKGSRLLTLSIRAPQPGDFKIDLDWTSKAYLNAPGSPEEILSAKSLSLSAVAGKDNISNERSDIDPPEAFAPEILRQGFTPLGPWTVIFSAVDKGSGIAGYEVAESDSRISPEDASKATGLDWRSAESPYVLSDQQLHSYVYVKAMDRKGNVLIRALGPQQPLPWYRGASWYIIWLLIAAAVAYRALHAKKRRTRS